MEKTQLNNRRYVYNKKTIDRVSLLINEFSSYFSLFRINKRVGIFNGGIVVSVRVNLRAISGRIGWRVRKSHFRSITKDPSFLRKPKKVSFLWTLRINQKILFLLSYIFDSFVITHYSTTHLGSSS
uniref:Uncharacterized protein n=1 Tax=Pleurozia purpurea TaxID=280637 RepID=D0R061_9MARC|nr:hypothetical protein PlpuMp62 [Pleurozia purpurea]ACR19398.1 hypothetical protein PlpuMp62 [Pleurozia purpurea]